MKVAFERNLDEFSENCESRSARWEFTPHCRVDSAAAYATEYSLWRHVITVSPSCPDVPV